MNPSTTKIKVKTVTSQKPTSDREITKIYINGQWIAAHSGRTFEVCNPTTGELLATVVDGGVIETKQAIDAAHLASQKWVVTSVKKRGHILQKVQQLLEARKDDIAKLIVLESGKSFPEASDEVSFALGYFNWYAQKVLRTDSGLISSFLANQRLWMQSQTQEVVAIITPWNFPLAAIARKLVPALAAGCTVILKPDAQAPLTALAIARIFYDAGFPSGVLNVVIGSNAFPISGEILINPKVTKIDFTSSAEAAKSLKHKSCGLGYLLAMWDYLAQISKTIAKEPEISYGSFKDSNSSCGDCQERLKEYIRGKSVALKIS